MNISIPRIFQLVKREYVVFRKPLALMSIVLFFFAGLIMFAVSDEHDADKNIPEDAGEIVFVSMLIFIGGIYTINTFREYQNHSRRIQYLMIPASHLEKLISKWLITLPLFILQSLIVFVLAYSIFGWLIQAQWELNFVSLSELNWKYVLRFTLLYYWFHAAYLLLATMFNKHPLLKSIVFGSIMFALGTFIVMLIFRLFMWEYFEGFFKPSTTLNYTTKWPNDEWLESNEMTFKLLLSFVLVPFLYLISFFKMKEKEA